MLTEDKIKLVRETLSVNREIATKELLQSGIDNNDIIKPKKRGIIENSRWGYYKLVDVSKVFDEGIKAIENQDFINSKSLFEKSISASYNVMESTYYLFLISLLNGEMEDAFKYFNTLYSNENDIISIFDLKFYLYLINYFYSVPEDYYQIVRNMELSDTVGSKKKYTISSQIKSKCFIGRFIDARNEINFNSNFQSKVMFSLINKVIEYLSKEKKQLLDLIKDKKYEKVYNLLLDMESYRKLSDYEVICLDIVEEIIQIFKKGEVLPKSSNISTDRLDVALKNKDYKRALEISNQFNKNKRIDNNNSHINLLLVGINEIIDNIDIVKDEIEQREKENTYNKLVLYLINGQIDEFTNELREYLANNSKLDYLFLIMDLIKIDSLLGDKLYSNTMLKFSCILNNNFAFDISEYMMKFYETLALKRFEEAAIYLDILEKSKKKKLIDISIDGFRSIYEKYVSGKNSLFAGVTGDLKPGRKKYTFNDLGIENTMEDLVNNKVLMMPRNVNIDYIKEVVNDLYNVTCFLINIDGETRVMLKYKERDEEEGVSLAIKL